MFDQRIVDPAEAAYYARQAALLDAVDESDMVDARPLVARAPTDAELCGGVAAGATRLVPALLSRLDAVDINALDAEAAVDAAVALDRVANRIAARRLRAIATAVRRHIGTQRVDPVRLAAAELGAALRLGSRSTDTEVTCALELAGRLSRTLAAMDTGDVSVGKARVLVDETIDLVDQHAQ